MCICKCKALYTSKHSLFPRLTGCYNSSVNIDDDNAAVVSFSTNQVSGHSQ